MLDGKRAKCGIESTDSLLLPGIIHFRGQFFPGGDAAIFLDVRKASSSVLDIHRRIDCKRFAR